MSIDHIFRYAKGHDPDNWLVIDEDTAEIRLNKMPDRESPFVVDGTYTAEVLCLAQGDYKAIYCIYCQLLLGS